jgi:hypothetical protein
MAVQKELQVQLLLAALTQVMAVAMVVLVDPMVQVVRLVIQAMEAMAQIPKAVLHVLAQEAVVVVAQTALRLLALLVVEV